jgi:hypothetical protein
MPSYASLLKPTRCPPLRSAAVGAGISEKVGTKPVGVEVLGQKLVLFRGRDGAVHCLHGARALFFFVSPGTAG